MDVNLKQIIVLLFKNFQQLKLYLRNNCVFAMTSTNHE